MPKIVLTDSEIILIDINDIKIYPQRLRLIKFYDDNKNQEFALMPHVFHLVSLEIAKLYKKPTTN